MMHFVRVIYEKLSFTQQMYLRGSSTVGLIAKIKAFNEKEHRFTN